MNDYYVVFDLNHVCEKSGASRFVGRASSFLILTCPRASA